MGFERIQSSMAPNSNQNSMRSLGDAWSQWQGMLGSLDLSIDA